MYKWKKKNLNSQGTISAEANKKGKHHNYTIMQPFDHCVEHMPYIYHVTKSRDSIPHDV